MILSTTDFTADYCIASDDYTSSDLESFIEEKEKELLSHLLGANLYLLLKSDLDSNNGVPTIPRFINIFNEQVLEFGCIEYLYCGLKKMLAKAIFFKYAIHQRTNNTISGNMQHKHQVSSASDYSRTELTRIWNEFKKEADMIQRYIMYNQDITQNISYTDYKGKCFYGASII